MAPKANIKDALARLERAEAEFLGSSFLAPVVRGHGVTVRIAGVCCTLRVVPPAFHGWGVFRPVSHAVATVAREATTQERRRYLALFPTIRLVTLERDGARAHGLPANAADDRFEICGPVEVQFVDDDEPFDTIVARYDGARFWFDGLDARTDPAAAAYLRRELAEITRPQKLDRAGLTGVHHAAYAAAHARRLAARVIDQRKLAEQRLGSALAHAGARLRDFTDATGDAYRVTYLVDGRRYTSVVLRHDLTLVSAGICLSGEDGKFDLGSLVGVLREGAQEGRLGWR